MVFIRYFHVLIPLIALAVNVIIQVASFRIIRKIGLLKSEYLGFFLGIIFLIYMETWVCFQLFLSLGESACIFIVNSLAYCALGYCYFHFINLNETARRIRILTELFYSENGLSQQEVLGVYNAEEIIGRRIKRLVDHGQVIEKNGKYFIGNPAFLLMAKAVEIMKSVIFG